MTTARNGCEILALLSTHLEQDTERATDTPQIHMQKLSNKLTGDI